MHWIRYTIDAVIIKKSLPSECFILKNIFSRYKCADIVGLLDQDRMCIYIIRFNERERENDK